MKWSLPADSSPGGGDRRTILLIDLRPRTTGPLLQPSERRPVEIRRHVPGPEEPHVPSVVVGTFDRDDLAQGASLARWARAQRAQLLAVAVGPSEALVGPLTLPDRIGCGECAAHRILAAAASVHQEAPAATTGSKPLSLAAVRRIVKDEIEQLEADAFGAGRLLSHVLRVDADGAVTRHAVVPLAVCGTCGGAGSVTHSRSSRPGGGGLEGWVDQLTGVIPALSLDSRAEGPSLPVVVTAAPPHLVDEDGSLRRLPLGWGKGLTPDEALRSALGEAIERYSASVPDPANIVWARPDDLIGDRLDPRLFPLYGEDQYARENFPYVPFDPRVRHPWVAGRWLKTGATVWVPATMVFLSLDVRPENLICQGTSNGLAASTDPEDAALRAVLELLERDAFMCAWRTGGSGKRIRVDESLDPPIRDVLDGLDAVGASIELLALPTAGSAVTVVCLGLGDGHRWPGVALGLAADFDPARATRQAILELGQTGPHLIRLVRSRAIAVADDEQSVRHMRDHSSFYVPAARASAFDQLRQACGSTSLADLAERAVDRTLDACADDLEAARVRVALVDVTSPDVATGPFRVVRAVSPDLQPISFGYGFERLPVPRIGSSVAPGGRYPIHPIW